MLRKHLNERRLTMAKRWGLPVALNACWYGSWSISFSGAPMAVGVRELIVATRTGTPLGTVKTRIRTAMIRLRGVLGPV
jgi:hypothetical protein